MSTWGGGQHFETLWGRKAKRRLRGGAQTRGASRRLVVWVHAYRFVEESTRTIRGVVESLFPDADLLMPRYRGGHFANTNPFRLAAELQTFVAAAWRERKSRGEGAYEEVIFVGYSAGALLVRKALVYGLGHLEDHPFPELARETAGDWEEIATRCRFLLVAGINRGWSLEERPPQMRARDYVLAKFGVLVGRLFPFVGRFILSLERGRPFVANLRVQWIRLCQERKERMPAVVQLLGSEDDVVLRDDNTDVGVTHQFIFIPVPYSGHRSILELDDTEIGRERRRRLELAITERPEELRKRYESDTGELMRESCSDEIRTLREAERPSIAFLMHGIRDNADWCRRLQRKIAVRDPSCYCVVASYGHFPMLHFLLFNRRKKNVRWFMDQYTEALAHLPGATVHFVGHSNGTYLLAEGLKSYRTLVVHRVAFMGSVVPSNYPWDRFHREGRIQALRNDRASSDAVVGIFPGMFQLVGNFLPFAWLRDIGNGGYRGFDRSAGRNHVENYYFPGGHGAAINDANLESLAGFVTTGTAEVPEGRLGAVNGFWSLLSRLCWAVWVALGAIVIALGIGAGAVWGAWGVVWYAGVLFAVLATI